MIIWPPTGIRLNFVDDIWAVSARGKWPKWRRRQANRWARGLKHISEIWQEKWKTREMAFGKTSRQLVGIVSFWFFSWSNTSPSIFQVRQQPTNKTRGVVRPGTLHLTERISYSMCLLPPFPYTGQTFTTGKTFRVDFRVLQPNAPKQYIHNVLSLATGA